MSVWGDNMKFHLKELLSKGQIATVNEQLDVAKLFRDRQDVISTGPLHIQLKLSPEGDIVNVEGNLEIDMELACSRCLESTKSHSSIPFAEQFKSATAETAEEAAEEAESDIIEIDGDRLDLQLYVEEYLLLFMPFAPLCKAECKGLCAQCGTNLNEEQCTCNNERIDPRLASLKDFFKE